MSKPSTPQIMTRRRFLQRIALAGGADALYHTMRATDLIPDSTYQGPLDLQGSGEGTRVIILGAGLAGLTAAYEMDKLGYECVILEPRRRAGGRCWTVRRGDQETEVGGAHQMCEFDEGLYFNPGPSRIPYHHRGILHYCKQFGVELDVFVNINRRTYFDNREVSGPLAGQPVTQRQAAADFRGYIAELLAKAITTDTLEAELTPEDQERLIVYLKEYGDLSEDLFYQATSRRGYITPPGAGMQPGELTTPFDLGALLDSDVWQYFHTLWGYNEQTTMLAPVGGMDLVAAGFVEHVGQLIRYDSEVRGIFRTPEGVRIIYHDLAADEPHEMTGDYCICTIPLPVLTYIPSDLPPAMQNAIRNVSYGTAVRLGMQFSRRFWEEDEGIYGGITWSDQTYQQIHYDSVDFQREKGVLLAAYPFGSRAFELAGLSPEQRLQRVLDESARVHPQYRDTFETGFSVAWHKIRYNLGCYTAYSTLARESFYPLLMESDGYIYLAGEHMSYLIGWQEGAILSALETVQRVHERVQQEGN